MNVSSELPIPSNPAAIRCWADDPTGVMRCQKTRGLEMIWGMMKETHTYIIFFSHQCHQRIQLLPTILALIDIHPVTLVVAIVNNSHLNNSWEKSLSWQSGEITGFIADETSLIIINRNLLCQMQFVSVVLLSISFMIWLWEGGIPNDYISTILK